MPRQLLKSVLVCLITQVLPGTNVASAAEGAAAPAEPRQRVNFDAGWAFHLGDPDDAKDGRLDYGKIKDYLLASANDFTKAKAVQRPDGDPGEDVSFVKPAFDDNSWRKLNLPHDWAIEGPFDINKPGETGKLPYWGQAWYRKRFALPAADEGRRVFLQIDGAMSYSTVWLNGKLLGGWPYGYASYQLEVTPHVKFGGAENVIAVRLNNPPDSSRWYPGSGIYRNVWLVTTSPLHVGQWGTYVTTPEVTPQSATVDLKVTLQNQGTSEARASVATRIYPIDEEDRKAAEAVASIEPVTETVPAGASKVVESKSTVPDPKLWDTTHPQRYVAVTEVSEGGKVVDRYETPFGIRTLKFDAEQGFLLNGQRVPLNGVCGHHDLGALGAAFNTRAARRQLEILKEMGCNALRTSHNMPAPELLDLCDKLGILVMDESFDCWKKGKKPHDYHLLFDDWHERDLRAEYRRDRNHPSIIMWSIGNEIIEQGKPQTAPLLDELVAIAHDEDPTRAASQGCNNAVRFGKEWTTPYDFFGLNYTPKDYRAFHEKNPALPYYGSETSSTVSSRGIYFFKNPLADFQVSSYDNYHPGWASFPSDEFKALDENPSAGGEFVWTGFDYLGEPTPYNADMTNLLNFREDPAKQAQMEAELKQFGKIRSPARSSYFGIVDLCGFKKDRFFQYQARWRPDLPMAHVLPHWNWPGREGQVTPVFVYTSGDEAELFLNGQSLGRQPAKPHEYRVVWDKVTYAPGELKAVAYKGGQRWAEDVVKTTGAPAAVRLEADRATIRDDGTDLSFITTKIVDAEGLTVPVAQNEVKFEVTGGPGEIVATDNGDATDLSIFSDPRRKAFSGLALAIVRAKPGQTGEIKLRATAEGLKPAEVTVTAR